ncbi:MULTISPECIES: hypothetical protein [unclassified Microbacterium]|uniref:hypothetical protein n=1 Tax=unclassified Microbacterium TaxID=2609290 RepID=UPI00386E7933
MYGALWRVLPGPWWVRVFILLVLLTVVLYLFYFHLFPWIFTLFGPEQESTIGGG